MGDTKMREYWIVLIDDTPDQPGTSNRHFRVEHAPAKEQDFGTVGGKPRCLEIIHVREVPAQVCDECNGAGGDCDAGDDGQTVSWQCRKCGGTGEMPQPKPAGEGV